ncbi:MAG: rRNA maturation RNase YbeY [Nitrospirae bacterium]|nr:rRNA maturation RNase YbeY [Nitrospirota bacterium]MCL5063023.1 rRNA maturation RNase YbeY [Nitrospirota bacterium]MDA8215642.1 rRNA maturation RNase YbeY [Nitrospiraceae bacterium]MDA8338775.1 rRNA maturation RNase YbeY [Nitrospiraceae bacterium]
MEIIIKNSQRLIRINRQRIESILKKALKHLAHSHPRKCYGFLESAEVSVLFVNDTKMRELNRQYRGKDKTTDVLSFPQIKRFERFEQLELSPIPLGDIVINLHQAKRQAKEHGLSFYDEVSWLLIHGLLHLLGYDHEKSKYQARKMREMERELLEVMGIR